jgi:hypothetical protein
MSTKCCMSPYLLLSFSCGSVDICDIPSHDAQPVYNSTLDRELMLATMSSTCNSKRRPARKAFTTSSGITGIVPLYPGQHRCRIGPLLSHLRVPSLPSQLRERHHVSQSYWRPMLQRLDDGDEPVHHTPPADPKLGVGGWLIDKVEVEVQEVVTKNEALGNNRGKRKSASSVVRLCF